MRIENQRRNEFRRVIHPEETISRVEASLKKLGILTYFTEQNPFEHLWSVQLSAPDLRIGSNGKGLTRMEAVASAYCELVERISIGMMCGIHIGPYRKLEGAAAEILDEIETFRYMDGYRWGHQDSFSRPTVKIENFLHGMSFTKGQLESLKMQSQLLRHWVPGYSLIHKKEVLVPPLFVKWISATNGIATGNTIEEAIVHACCEVFERDALIKYLRNTTPGPAKTINKSTIQDNRLIGIINYFEKNNVEVIVKDIGYDTYPVMAIMTFNHNMKPDRLGMNFIKAGCAFSSTEALFRCFTERMQGTSFATEALMEPDQVVELDQKYMPIMFSGVCPFSLQPFKIESEEAGFVDFNIADTAVEIDNCISIAKTLSTDIIVIDHTHPVFGLPTVQVVMPGVSDFMKWWDSSKLTADFIGNIQPEEDLYEKHLEELLRTFRQSKDNASTARNKCRRDT